MALFSGHVSEHIKGMKINPSKNGLLCISAARSYLPRTFIDLGGGNFFSSKTVKLLGFTFSTTPIPEAHIQTILKKARYRSWQIWHLKRLGLSPEGLINVFRSMIRPIMLIMHVLFIPQ